MNLGTPAFQDRFFARAAPLIASAAYRAARRTGTLPLLADVRAELELALLERMHAGTDAFAEAIDADHAIELLKQRGRFLNIAIAAARRLQRAEIRNRSRSQSETLAGAPRCPASPHEVAANEDAVRASLARLREHAAPKDLIALLAWLRTQGILGDEGTRSICEQLTLPVCEVDDLVSRVARGTRSRTAMKVAAHRSRARLGIALGALASALLIGCLTISGLLQRAEPASQDVVIAQSGPIEALHQNGYWFKAGGS